MTSGDYFYDTGSYAYDGGSCSPTTTVGSYNIGTFGGSVTAGGSTLTPNFQHQPMTGTDMPWNAQACALGHVVNEESIFEEDGTDTTPPRIAGTCITCGQLMKFARIPGGMPYHKAGKLIGEAMALDDDDEWLPEVLGDLVILEATIDREVEKLRRAKQLVTLSRSIATRKAITNAETDVTEN